MFLISLAAAQTTVNAESPVTNGQLFRPSIDSTHTLWVNDSGRSPDGYFMARGVVHYALNPVVYESNNGDVTRIVGDLFQLSLTAGYSKGPIRFGVDVPVFLRSAGSEEGETGIGDIALDLKATLLDRTTKPLGLALAGRASLPTSTVDAPLGNGGFGWEFEGIVDKDVGNLLLAANIGLRGAPRRELENFTWGEQLIGRLGGGYAFTETHRSGISLDFATHVNVSDPKPEAIPVEGIVGAWGGVQSLVIRGGVGTALSNGFGAPTLRAILSIGYEPPKITDKDGDGITDRDDACPEEPEDADGFRDEDGCPEPTALLVKIVDEEGKPIEAATFKLFAEDTKNGGHGDTVPLYGGRYKVDVEAEGYKPLMDQKVDVPDQERVEVAYTLKKDIKPGSIKVNVKDGDGADIPDSIWVVLKEKGRKSAGETRELNPGEYTIRAKSAGWRPVKRVVTVEPGELTEIDVTMVPATVEITAERIDLKESVYFETGKAVIKTESFPLLEEVSVTIMDHAELTKIRIEGHTDSRGDDASNLELSKARAAAVQAFLVKEGVKEARLESDGYGETRPIAKGENEEAWSQNRRVDFFVAERSDGDAPAPEPVKDPNEKGVGSEKK